MPMIAALLLACSSPSPPEEPMPFRITAAAEPLESSTRVTLRVRTPGGDIPVQRAELRDATASLDGEPVEIQDVVFEPGIHGCILRFQVGGAGTLALSGHLDLLNPDGSRWTTLELPGEVGRVWPPRP